MAVSLRQHEKTNPWTWTRTHVSHHWTLTGSIQTLLSAKERLLSPQPECRGLRFQPVKDDETNEKQAQVLRIREADLSRAGAREASDNVGAQVVLPVTSSMWRGGKKASTHPIIGVSYWSALTNIARVM